MARTRALVVVLLALSSSQVSGFSLDQHRAICDVAWELLTDEGRSFVQKIRREAQQAAKGVDHDAASTFFRSCVWPDSSRKSTHISTYENHFLNVRKDDDAVRPGRDCLAYDCAPVAIIRFSTVINRYESTNRRMRERRGEALAFLGHFVADLHQPLHAGHLSDLGGNDIAVRYRDQPRPTNLHAVWDGDLPRAAGVRLDRVEVMVAEIRELDAQTIGSWRDADVWQWASDSYELAKNYAYRNPDKSLVRKNDSLSEAYVRAALPKVREQALKAAVRLAHLIETLASGTNPFDGAGPR